MYGMRIVAPFVIGMSGITVPRFVILNIISAFCWAAVFSVGGYFFGASLQIIIGDIRQYGIEFMILLGVAGLLIWMGLMYRDKIRKNNNE
jgi:membrane protein DedA with SNARE-associated domain